MHIVLLGHGQWCTVYTDVVTGLATSKVGSMCIIFHLLARDAVYVSRSFSVYYRIKKNKMMMVDWWWVPEWWPLLVNGDSGAAQRTKIYLLMTNSTVPLPGRRGRGW